MTLRDDLATALKDAMLRRDRVGVSVCRTALAAIANAEAVDAAHVPAAGALELAPTGAEVARRVLTEADVRAVLEVEVAERRLAIAHVDDGEWRRQRLHEVEVLEAFLR